MAVPATCLLLLCKSHKCAWCEVTGRDVCQCFGNGCSVCLGSSALRSTEFLLPGECSPLHSFPRAAWKHELTFLVFCRLPRRSIRWPSRCAAVWASTGCPSAGLPGQSLQLRHGGSCRQYQGCDPPQRAKAKPLEPVKLQATGASEVAAEGGIRLQFPRQNGDWPEMLYLKLETKY